MCAGERVEVVTLDEETLRELLSRVRTGEPLDSADRQLIEDVVKAYCWLSDRLEAKDLSLAKLQQMLFGVKSERKDAVFPPEKAGDQGAQGAPDSDGNGDEAKKGGQRKRKGHGRNGVSAYAGAQRVPVPYQGLSKGCRCPSCERGKMYGMRPERIVRIVGRPGLQATIYEPERWRCNVCGAIYTAKLPKEAGEKKYDETAGSMMALLKYGSGVPFYRLECLQSSLQTPLPASTQWEIVAELAGQVSPVHEALVREAAQGEVLHNDDTSMTVLDLKKENEGPDPPERTGIFTTGVVSVHDGHRAALFFTGRKHAGERLEDLLRRRSAELDAPIQMCDALTRNVPKAFEVILGNCLAHGRRHFVEQAGNFPDECRHVLEQLAEVYRNDAHCAKHVMTKEDRLAYHQAHSGPVMVGLKAWMEAQVTEKKVEPNSGLGRAMGYLIKHWEPLTLFLRQAGAPLDNNVVERSLKKAILHRKNSLFYRTENGARVGDILMSLIHTCQLNGANPFDYLTALQKNIAAVHAAPTDWLPWNYRKQTDIPSRRTA